MGDSSFKSQPKKKKKKNWERGVVKIKFWQTKEVNLGWHMDRKENPISAPSIHDGALVGAGSLSP